MRLADVEARDLMVRALLRTAEIVRDKDKLDMPFEWTDGTVGFFNPNASFKHPTTGAILHGAVYVLISDDAEDIAALMAALLKPDDDH